MRTPPFHRVPTIGRRPGQVVRPESYDWPRPAAEPDAFATEVGAVMRARARQKAAAAGGGAGDATMSAEGGSR